MGYKPYNIRCCADLLHFSDTIFSSYLYVYGMCSEAFNFDPVKANNILTIYWIAFAVGRGSGIILTRYITSWLFVIIGCVGSIIGVAGIIGTDYLISEDASEAAREASLITNTVIFGFFVSVSLKRVVLNNATFDVNKYPY